MFQDNDQRDLALVAAGKSPVGEFSACVARCLLALEEGVALALRPMPAEESVTPEHPMGQALAALEPEIPTLTLNFDGHGEENANA